MKILIWNNFKLENKGGPSGYLYNLSKFKNIKYPLDYLNRYSFQEEKKESIIKKNLKKIELLLILNKIRNTHKKEDIKYEDILEKRYDILHYHSTVNYYKNRDFLERYKGIKVLTSHSPQLTSEEKIEELGLKNEFLKKIGYNYTKNLDIYSFKNADYLIFPCEEAMEPYLNRDEEIRDILTSRLKENKIKFLPTGIIDKKIEFQDEYFYKKFGIPKDAIVLCYLGRHNEIKGYDLLVQAGKEILEKHKDVYIIVGGQINPNIKPLNHERWIELGWTTEGDNIMKHAHAYLLPNRETYFDLVFIEALRAGATIICSETGGNKYFKNFNSSEIVYFEKENIQNIVEVVEKKLEVFKNKDYILNRKENRKLYEDNFTVEKFGSEYINIMEEIYEESKKSKE